MYMFYSMLLFMHVIVGPDGKELKSEDPDIVCLIKAKFSSIADNCVCFRYAVITHF